MMSVFVKQIRDYEDLLYFGKCKNEKEKQLVKKMIAQLTEKRNLLYSN
jgi:hypothetical protein